MTKKKILVIANYENRNHEMLAKHAPSRLDVNIAWIRSFFVAWDGHEIHIQNPESKMKFGDYDAYYLAGWRTDTQLGLVMAQWLKRHNKQFIGHTPLGVFADSKLGEMTNLVGAGIAYPRSFYASKPEDIVKLFSWASQHFDLQFPVVVKATRSQMGLNNFLAHDLDELKSLPLDANRNYIMQEFIPNNCDYRVLIIGGKIQLIMKRTRTNKNTHVNNTAQGAIAEFIDPASFPKAFQAMALRAARALGRSDVAGVDIVIDEDTHKAYVLEVNRTPAIATGVSEDVDIALKLRILYEQLERMAQKAQKQKEVL